MIIKLSPQRRDDELVVSKRGDVLTINTERFDFREIPEGAVLPASAVDCEFIVGDITRLDGELMLTLLMPCSADASAAATYPADIVNPSDGNVRFPQ